MAYTPTMHEILRSHAVNLKSIKKREEKVQYVRDHMTTKEIQEALAFFFNKHINWSIPDGDPPYKKEMNEAHGAMRGMLIRGDFQKYLEGYYPPNANRMRIESNFISTLEQMHPDDAVLLLKMKSKKWPYGGVTKKLVKEAWPDMTSQW